MQSFTDNAISDIADNFDITPFSDDFAAKIRGIPDSDLDPAS